MSELKLERCTLTYTHISPFRLNRVGQAERKRYIETELNGVEPQVPTYTVKCGGGVLPSGKELPTWDETSDYTVKHIISLQAEYNNLKNRAVAPSDQARLVVLHNAIETWKKYVEVLNGINYAVNRQRWNVGLWHVFRENMPDDDDWIKEQKLDGIDISEIPDDERGRLRYWLETEAVSTQEEFNDLIRIVEGHDDKVKEARRIARDMFQRSVGA